MASVIQHVHGTLALHCAGHSNQRGPLGSREGQTFQNEESPSADTHCLARIILQ